MPNNNDRIFQEVILFFISCFFLYIHIFFVLIYHFSNHHHYQQIKVDKDCTLLLTKYAVYCDLVTLHRHASQNPFVWLVRQRGWSLYSSLIIRLGEKNVLFQFYAIFYHPPPHVRNILLYVSKCLYAIYIS